MIIKCNFKLGSSAYQFEVDEKDEMDTLHKAIVLTNPRMKCVCGTSGYDSKYFTTNKDKEGNIYINVKCAKCGARSKLGRYKTGGYFWHDYEIWKREGSTPVTPEKDINDFGDGDVPM